MNVLKKIFTKNTDNELLGANNDTNMFSLKNKFKKCKIVNVYDGDTCKAVFYLHNKLYK